MGNYWLCVTNEQNWQVVKRQKVWGVSERNKKIMANMAKGDFLVFYIKPKKLAGAFKVVSDTFESQEEIFNSTGFAKNETFPNRVRLEPMIIPSEPIAFEKLVPKLRFITYKERWRVYLRKAMRMISKESFEMMKRALEEA